MNPLFEAGAERAVESIAPGLLVAKFVPGFASVATAMAGAVRLPPLSFLLFDPLGATLWAGSGLGIGRVFSDAVEEVMQTLVRFGQWGLGAARGRSAGLGLAQVVAAAQFQSPAPDGPHERRGAVGTDGAR